MGDADLASAPALHRQVRRQVATSGAARVRQIADRGRQAHAFATSLLEASERLEDASTPWYWFNDDEAVATARKMRQTAEACQGLADASNELVELLEGQTDDRLTGVSDTAGQISDVLRALELFTRLTDDRRTQAFIENPEDLQAGLRWANETAGLFSDAAALIPEQIEGAPLMGPVLRMMKGYLEAPANYVRVVGAIIEARVNRIDALTGGEAVDMKVTAGETLWRGPLSRIYAIGYHNGLARFMESHRNEDGIDLESASYEVGIEQLRALIRRHAPRDREARWLRIVNGQP